MIEQKVFTSKKMLELAARKEWAVISEMLKVAGINENTEVMLTADQLSRREAESVERNEISEALTKNSLTALAAALRLAHEANRARRDINIAEASHKKLMLGVYRTMYQRKLKLERKIQEEQYA